MKRHLHCAEQLWDAQHNGTTTLMFDSRNTWNAIYIARSNYGMHNT